MAVDHLSLSLFSRSAKRLITHYSLLETTCELLQSMVSAQMVSMNLYSKGLFSLKDVIMSSIIIMIL